MFQRAEIEEIKKRLSEPRKHIQVIMGPRQVGKTTLARQLMDKTTIPAIYESADAMQAAGSTWLEQIWNTARLKVRTGHHMEGLLVIDEIQKIHNWSETVKKLWDEDSFNQTKLKIILLGSSRLLIQKGLTESLAGRFETIYLGHWSFPEMQMAFGWDEETYTWFGGYPGSAHLIQDEKRWKSYVKDALIETSISKDIFQLSQINKPTLLKNLFELGCIYSGQIVSFTKMLGQIQDAGNTTTLAHYLHLLDTAGLLGGLEKIAHSKIRQRGSSPKFQVYNTALISAQHQQDFANISANPAAWGRMVESVVGSHLINHSLKENYTLYYWREKNWEVDFVLEKKDRLVALEVKSAEAKNVKGLEAFKRKFNHAKLYVIDNKALSWKEFLTLNPMDLF